MEQSPRAKIIDPAPLEWHADQRFPGVLTKTLLTAAQNPQASVHLIRLPPGATITRHTHEREVETAYMITGRCLLTLGSETLPFLAGQIASIVAGVAHAVHNDGPAPVEILTLFTPPRV